MLQQLCYQSGMRVASRWAGPFAPAKAMPSLRRWHGDIRTGFGMGHWLIAPFWHMFMKCSSLRTMRGVGSLPFLMSKTSRGSRTASRPKRVGAIPVFRRNFSIFLNMVMDRPFLIRNAFQSSRNIGIILYFRRNPTCLGEFLSLWSRYG